jgi:hypothetical protein
MASLGVLIVTFATGESNPIPYFSAEDRADIEQWARAMGWRVEPRQNAADSAAREAQAA